MLMFCEIIFIFMVTRNLLKSRFLMTGYSVMRCLTVILITIISLLGNVSIARDFSYRNISIADGLANNHCWHIDALDNHTMLVAYPDVFTIYDGARSHSCEFDVSKAFRIDGYSTKTFRDRYGRLWIKNYKYIYVYDQERNLFLDDLTSELKPGGITGDIADIFSDGNGNMILFTGDGKLYAYDFVHPATLVMQLSPQDMKAGNVPVEVGSVGDRTLVFFADGTITVVENGKVTGSCSEFSGDVRLFDTVVWQVLDRNHMLIGLEKKGAGLVLFNTDGNSFRVIDPTPRKFVKILLDTAGNIYVVSSTDVQVFDSFMNENSRWTDIISRLQLKDRNVSDAALDWQGGLWLTTYLNGIWYVSSKGNAVESLDLPDNEQLLSLAVYDDRHLVYCTRNRVSLFDVVTEEFRLLYQDTDRSVLTNTVVDSTGNIWINTKKSLLRFTGGKTELAIRAGAYFAIPVDDKVYTVGEHDQFGFYSVSDRTFHPCPIPDDLPVTDKLMNRACLDRVHQRIICGNTSTVLYTYDLSDGKWGCLLEESDRELHMKSRPSVLYTDRDGNIWAGTQTGLTIVWNDGEVQSLSVNDGLPDNMVRGIIQHKPDTWLVTTATGLVALVRNEQGGIRILSHNLTGRELSDEMVDGCLVELGDDIWSGTAGQLVCLHPDYTISDDSLPSTPVLTSFKLRHSGTNLSNLNAGEGVKLDYRDNFFTLSFSTCNYMAPEQDLYQYQLEGVDREWVTGYTKDGTLDISYTNVPPGKYRFLVRINDKNNCWSETGTLNIRITPPWWKTWWAYFLYALLLACIVFVIRRAYRQYLQLMEKLKDKHNKYIIQAKEVKAEDVVIEPRDEIFLKKAVSLVEQNLENSDYNVDRLSRDMGLSRSQFYRKLQSIAGQSPTVFIRTIRLRRAAQLIKESDMNVSEVGYSCGFNNLSAFRKYFKELYGVPPSSYR